jgi:hypothetical protein
MVYSASGHETQARFTLVIIQQVTSIGPDRSSQIVSPFGKPGWTFCHHRFLKVRELSGIAFTGIQLAQQTYPLGYLLPTKVPGSTSVLAIPLLVLVSAKDQSRNPADEGRKKIL